MSKLSIEVNRKADHVQLIFWSGEDVLDEHHIPIQLARSLRSALEAVIAGRYARVMARDFDKGKRSSPITYERGPQQPPSYN